MSLSVNLRLLDLDTIELQGEISAADLGLENIDELVHANQPLRYDLEVSQQEGAALVQGHLELELDCECSRCLKPFKLKLDFPGWACHIPLEGEEKAEIVNDSIDLTPYIREDILLSFPQHPLCETKCDVLHKSSDKQESKASSAWAELNKLKL